MATQVGLPLEVLELIFSHDLDQASLHACAIVSRLWYSASIAKLYYSPVITGKNYDAFIRSVCPSINAHIRHNGLAELVRTLDMSRLVHNGSKSLTARLLGRLKGGLEVFIAPQASFAINSLAALSKCSHLHHLDLSLVSEAIPIPDLLHSLRSLSSLRTLSIPRAAAPSSVKINAAHKLPSSLRELYISGGLSDKELLCMSNLTPSMTHLTVEHCSKLSIVAVHEFLAIVGPQLQFLRLTTPVIFPNWDYKSPPNAYPNLSHLTISSRIMTHYFHNMLGLASEYVPGDGFFISSDVPSQWPLSAVATITLGSLDSDDPASFDVFGRVVWAALLEDYVYDGGLSSLRKVKVHRKIGWLDVKLKYQARKLNDLLKALAREDGDKAAVSEEDAGVSFFGLR